jgi:hypothetical protein
LAVLSFVVPAKQSNRSSTRTFLKPAAPNTADELCFQQSAGDSTGPEIDVSQRAVGKDFANDDVRDLRTTA